MYKKEELVVLGDRSAALNPSIIHVSGSIHVQR